MTSYRLAEHIAKPTLNKGCVPRIYKDLLQVSDKNRNKSIKNDQDLYRLIIKNDIRMASKHM